MTLVVLTLSACGDDDQIEYSGGRSDLSIKTDAQVSVRAKLRDPDSAVFSNLRVSTKGGADVVCGEVNSRNGLGGMSGKQQFVSNGYNLSFLEEEVIDGGWTDVWQRFC
ncbi:MAG: hypothetical protein ABJP70_01200 [Erythrobacter sp.]|uniref:hypothetical protein n=1 Tax=Parasphingorhabdus sp. TaxID=2709688 RepID=UPI00326D8622